MLYIPLWAQWTILNFTGSCAWIGPTVIKQLLQGPRTDLNIIFPVTWISAVTSFIIIFILLTRRTSVLDSLLIAAATQFGTAFLFEFVFSIVALYRYGYPVLEGNPYYLIAGFSWLVMLLCGIGYWSLNNIFYASAGIFVFGFALWIWIGFPILEGSPSIVLNYFTKIAAFSIVTSLYMGH